MSPLPSPPEGGRFSPGVSGGLGCSAEIVAILDKFDALTNDLSEGLPAELAMRRSQYEYYRDKLLTFNEKESA